MQQEIKLVKQFDKNGDGWLNLEERKAAREYLKTQPSNRGPGGRRGGRPGFGPRGQEGAAPQPGPKLGPSEVKSFPDAPLYASNVLRTVFLEFESSDWEKEMAEFKHTDVQVPAKLTVDGKVYPDVGVHFHGMSSFMMVGREGNGPLPFRSILSMTNKNWEVTASSTCSTRTRIPLSCGACWQCRLPATTCRRRRQT
jgi:hypothetical protein